MSIKCLFNGHEYQDTTTPWNSLWVTHLRCMNCNKLVSAFYQKYKRKTHGRVKVL